MMCVMGSECVMGEAPNQATTVILLGVSPLKPRGWIEKHRAYAQTTNESDFFAQKEHNFSSRPSFLTFNTRNESPDRELHLR